MRRRKMTVRKENTMTDQTNIVEKALAFAAIAYQGQTQELSGVPRIVGVSETVVLMASIEPKDRDLMAAAALWNITERTDITWEEIEETFGPRMKGILASTQIETARPDMDPEEWSAAREAEVAALKRLPLKLKMVVLAEKLAEVRFLYREYGTYREDLWQRLPFSDPNRMYQYYYGISDVMQEFEEYAAYTEYNQLVARLFIAHR
ncbi:MAG: HD domain-containing protein [Firmicutes bacterium]|nr:HD domain-containing protein [Bacillota bacterium]